MEYTKRLLYQQLYYFIDYFHGAVNDSRTGR